MWYSDSLIQHVTSLFNIGNISDWFHFFSSINKSSPLSFSGCLLENIVFSVEVHGAVFQVEFPFVPSSGNFIILAYNNIFCIKQITRIPLRYVITTTKGIILSPFTFSIFFVSINVVIRVIIVVIIVINIIIGNILVGV